MSSSILQKQSLAELLQWQLPKSFDVPSALREPAAPAVPAYREPAPPDVMLTLSQKCALLQMSEVIAHQFIWRAIQGKGPPPFTRSDFVELRGLNLAQMGASGQFHILTGGGRAVAFLAGRQLQKERDIHECWIGGSIAASTTLSCTCSWSCGLVRGERMQLKAANAFSHHLRDLIARRERAVAPLAPDETESS